MNKESQPITIEDLKDAKGLVIAHLNIRSLLPKIEYLSYTRFYDNFVRLDRAATSGGQTKVGGGVGIYIEQGLNFVPDLETWSSTPDIETLSIYLIPNNCRRFFITTCYRPPTGNFNNFFEMISTILENHNDVSRKLDLLLIGDINVNLLSKTNQAIIDPGFSDHNLIYLIKKKDFLKNTILNIVNDICPKCRFKIQENRPIWYSDEIITASNNCHRLARRATTSKDPLDSLVYNQARNALKTLINKK